MVALKPPGNPILQPSPSPRAGARMFYGALLVIVGLFGYQFWKGYETRHREALVTVDNLSTVLANDIQNDFDRAQSDIRVFADQITPDDLAGRSPAGRRDDLERRMGNHLRSFPAVLNYRVFDAEGRPVFGAGSLNPHSAISIADRLWFNQLRNEPGRDLVISEVVPGKTAAIQIVVMAVPVRDGSGQFIGTVMAAMNLAHFQQLVDSLKIGERGLVTVRLSEDSPIEGGAAERLIHAGNRYGEGDVDSPVDHVRRSFAVRRLERYPLTVAVAVAADDYLVPWRQETALEGAAALALIGVLMLLYRRQVRAQERLNCYAQALEVSEGHLASKMERYRALLKTASDGIHVLDPKGNLVEASQSFLQSLGYREADIERLNVVQWDARFSAETLALDIFRRLSSEAVMFETRHRRRDGSVFDVEINARAVELDGATYIYASARDITERKRAEEVLRASEERMRLFFERQLVGMAITSPQKGWLQVNDRLCEMLGYSREELAGVTWAELTHPDDLERDMQQFQRVLSGEIDQYNLEKRFVRRDGATVHTYLSLGCVRHADGSVAYFLALLADITNRIAMEEALKDAERMQRHAREVADAANEAKSRFLAAASHDLRQPLYAAQLYCDQLISGKRVRGQDPLPTLKSCLDTLSGMLAETLQRCKEDLQASAARRERVCLDACVEEVANLYRAAAASKGLRLSTVPSSLTAVTDPSALHHILLNLVSNAVRYTERGGVVIGCRRREGAVRVEVWDTGRGIAEDDLPRIFEEFRQVGGPQDAGDKGTGLGLAIVLRTANELGHRVDVRSRLGRGSVFGLEILRE